MKYFVAKQFFIILIAFIIFSCEKREIIQNEKETDSPSEKRFEPIRIILNKDWYMASSEEVNSSVQNISAIDYDLSGWYKIKMPSSVVAGLVENNVYKDIFKDKKMRELPGMGYPIGSSFTDFDMPDDSPFKVPWLYRTIFDVKSEYKGKKIFLKFEGINYSAKIFLNGKQIADNKTIVGPFRTFELDVTDYVKFGERNVLLLKIVAPEPRSLSITWVDWNPYPPDKNMGILNDVSLIVNGDISLRDTQVISDFDVNYPDKVYLTIFTTLKNFSDKDIECTIKGEIENISFNKKVKLKAKEMKEIELSYKDLAELTINNPRLWWIYTLGEPYLYNLRLSVYLNDEIMDTEEVRFGIRKVESEMINGDSMLFKLNGKKVLILGGGYTPDMLYRIDPIKERFEMEYIKDMGLNAIRLEGKLGLDNLINLADEYGVFVLASFCCCDMWERWSVWQKEHYDIAYNSLRDQIKRLRNHPSMLLWLNGADFHPPKEVERNYLNILKEERMNIPVTSSATESDSEVSGKSGVKMNGPYDWVPPDYWYLDKNFGGAFSFNTEVGVGPAIPEYESLSKFISYEYLWPINEIWNYHAGGGAFKNIDYFYKSVSQRFGSINNLTEFIWFSQMMSYEGERGMFEAHIRNRYRATGVIKWMLNNAWPSIIWHLYDYYLKPSGGYFGAKKALSPVHIFYAYDDDKIYVSNRTNKDFSNLRFVVELYNLLSEKIYKVDGNLDIASDEVRSLKDIISIISDENEIYFLNLILFDSNGKSIDKNFYWLKKNRDVMDWEKTEWYYTPVKEYADYSKLRSIPLAKILSNFKRIDDFNYSITLRNQSEKIAFFVRTILLDKDTQEEIKPILYEDNFISLMPFEKREIRVKVLKKNENIELRVESPFIE